MDTLLQMIKKNIEAQCSQEVMEEEAPMKEGLINLKFNVIIAISMGITVQSVRPVLLFR